MEISTDFYTHAGRSRAGGPRCFSIISNKEIAPGHFKMEFRAPAIAKKASPGKFVHVRCAQGCEPLLRRPFSIHALGANKRENVAILYKVIGSGTEILSKKKPGEKLDILGPLGNGFTIPPKRYPLNHILVGGGIGVAPLLFLAETISSKGGGFGHGCGQKIRIIIGARTKKLVLCEDEFKKLGAEVIVATEDGSKGRRGLATEALSIFLKTYNLKLKTVLYGCGPRPMLKELAKIAKQYKIQCQVSLEERMACGIGACMGCVTAVKTGKMKVKSYKRVCVDGPVFDANEIIW